MYIYISDSITDGSIKGNMVDRVKNLEPPQGMDKTKGNENKWQKAKDTALEIAERWDSNNELMNH